jgi:hypothetical protein
VSTPRRQTQRSLGLRSPACPSTGPSFSPGSSRPDPESEVLDTTAEEARRDGHVLELAGSLVDLCHLDMSVWLVPTSVGASSGSAPSDLSRRSPSSCGE